MVKEYFFFTKISFYPEYLQPNMYITDFTIVITVKAV